VSHSVASRSRSEAGRQPLLAGRGPERDIAVLVVDDHRAFREALRGLVDASRGFVVAGMACSGEEAVHASGSLTPDVVLMDVVMPGMGGIAAARAILSRCPQMMVVLISVDDPALHAGASALGAAVACVRKQDLRPAQLQELWETHRG
jgi:DNA-binding NarL/FixJ family response regulator